MTDSEVNGLEIGSVQRSTNTLLPQDNKTHKSAILTDEDMSSEETTTVSSDGEDESEIIQLQYDEDDDSDFQSMLNRPGYKRMELKGESESDKDLIIYSLNESLQIHKEIVERIQSEKDDIEDIYEKERLESRHEIERERYKVEEQKAESDTKVNKLETMYQALIKELETKKLDYRRMESRFYSHIKSIRGSTDDEQVDIPVLFEQMIGQINNLCNSLIKSQQFSLDKARASNYIQNFWSNSYRVLINDQFSSLDHSTIAMFTEKILIETIMQDVLCTSIHPGVSLNTAFGKIHEWVAKRNASWATRMKQQITAFVVKQSNEEHEQIEQAKEYIVLKMLNAIKEIYFDEITLQQQESIETELAQIVNCAARLNFAFKCQESPLQIIPVQEGGTTNFDEKYFTSVTKERNLIMFVISPPIVAADDAFIIPGKVHCI